MSHTSCPGSVSMSSNVISFSFSHWSSQRKERTHLSAVVAHAVAYSLFQVEEGGSGVDLNLTFEVVDFVGYNPEIEYHIRVFQFSE